MNRWWVACLVVAVSGLPLQSARAASDVGLKSVGVDLGYVSPENVDGTLGFGAFADLGALSPKVRLSTHLGYWSKSEGDPILQSEATIRDISLMTRARYLFPSSSKFQPYAGGVEQSNRQRGHLLVEHALGGFHQQVSIGNPVATSCQGVIVADLFA